MNRILYASLRFQSVKHIYIVFRTVKNNSMLCTKGHTMMYSAEIICNTIIKILSSKNRQYLLLMNSYDNLYIVC